MSITEIRCLQTSTHLLGTILHLDDVIGTFAGRQVAVYSDSLAVTLLSVATRVAVTAALIFVEFGILSLYSPLLTGVLIVGMYFYPVPEQTIAPIRPRLPPVGAEPPPLISGTLPRITYPPDELRSPAHSPASTTGPTTPAASPSRPPSGSFNRSPRPDSLVRRSLIFEAPPLPPLSTSMISPQSPRETDPAILSRSAIPSPSPAMVTPHSWGNSTGSELDVEEESESSDDNDNCSLLGSSAPPSSPPERQIEAVPSSNANSTLIHRRVVPPTSPQGSVVNHPIEIYQAADAKAFLMVIFMQALGEDLGPFFLHNMLPPNITSTEYNSATRKFTITLSAPKEATIGNVGPNAIAGVQGCSLKIQNVVRGTLDDDMQGITFQGESMQMSGTKLFISYTMTLKGLRWNNETITLKGNHWSGNGNVSGTSDQFRDTFCGISWTA